MKTFLHLCFFTAFVSAANSLNAQVTYNINSSTTYSAAKIPTSCTNCIINIKDGVVLTVDNDIYLQNTVFNGGRMIFDGTKLTFWSASQLNNVIITFKNKSSIVSSGDLTITGSEFCFYNTAVATIYTSVTMNASTWKFFDDSYLNATGGSFNLTNNSTLFAGDGTSASESYLKFNGATLNEYDNSYVSLGSTNNYYFNWADYNASSVHKSFKTTDNKMNCGGAGQNKCSSAMLYGPATMNFAGVSSFAMLPVKLSAFSVKLSGSKVDVSWTTDQEINSSRFVIERSTDGLNWKPVGTVGAKGNSSVVSTYKYTDAAQPAGTISYRLKMIDLDEVFEYSPIKSVKIATSNHEMNIYPNPATNYVIISSKSGVTGNISVQLINQSGQVLKQVNGGGSVNVSLSEFRSGYYIVRVLDADGTSQSFKLVITKQS